MAASGSRSWRLSICVVRSLGIGAGGPYKDIHFWSVVLLAFSIFHLLAAGSSILYISLTALSIVPFSTSRQGGVKQALVYTMFSFGVLSGANALLLEAANAIKQDGYVGSFTTSPYDIAWVSMVMRKDDSSRRMFPQCFERLLQEQLEDGSWRSGPSQIDAILNTLAALLALQRSPSTYAGPASRAISFLKAALLEWRVQDCIHVGFEILVPAHLRMLEAAGICFVFPGKEVLLALNQQKLAKFRPEMLYLKSSTMHHSLEAFTDSLDFDKLRHLKSNGSMMGSPSATAAYLMNVPDGDVEAEEYLAAVVKGYGGTGGVPSAYPTTTFEVSWILSTFLTAGFKLASLDQDSIQILGDYLEQQLVRDSGLVGFSPSMLADADDTAKTVLSLNLLGRNASPKALLDHFTKKNGYLSTYIEERNSSFSANCNALCALLWLPNPHEFQTQIIKITTHLCSIWLEGDVSDKWNLSSWYPAMLMCQAMIKLLHLSDSSGTIELADTLTDKILLILISIADDIHDTHVNNNLLEVEERAYIVLTLKALLELPLPVYIQEDLTAINMVHQGYLHRELNESSTPARIWVEKVSYGSSTLARCYTIAALCRVETKITWKSPRLLDVLSLAKSSRIRPMFQVLPSFKLSKWKLEITMLQSNTFNTALVEARGSIFPKRPGVKDRFLAYIPLSWIVPGHVRGKVNNWNLLWNLMDISLSDFLIDEYIETKVASLDDSKLIFLQSFVKRMLGHQPYRDAISDKSEISACPINTALPNGNTPSDVVEVCTVLQNYVLSLLQHPRVAGASKKDKDVLRRELLEFLLAHMNQLEESKRFSDSLTTTPEGIPMFSNPEQSYYSWVNTTAAKHTSCHISFGFMACILSSTINGGRECFPTARAYFIASDLCQQLAVLSRMYNDWASIDRDAAEGNLNSVNFPDFHSNGACSAKEELYGLAEYKRRCASDNLIMLEAELRRAKANTGIIDAIISFFDTTILYAEMYVVKDLTSRVKPVAEKLS